MFVPCFQTNFLSSTLRKIICQECMARDSVMVSIFRFPKNFLIIFFSIIKHLPYRNFDLDFTFSLK